VVSVMLTQDVPPRPVHVHGCCFQSQAAINS
jgi:hypothetical protein